MRWRFWPTQLTLLSSSRSRSEDHFDSSTVFWIVNKKEQSLSDCAHVDIVEHCVSPPQHPRPLAANWFSLLCSSLPDFGARESSNHQSAQCGSARFQFRTWQHMSGRLPPLPLHYPLTPMPLSRPPWLIYLITLSQLALSHVLAASSQPPSLRFLSQ